MARVTLKELDEWLFRGLGGIVNMLVFRVQRDEGFNRNCKLMLDNEIKRLGEVKCEVDARQIKEHSPVVANYSVLDTWFVRSYTGINNWLRLRSEEGPPMDSANLDELQAHIDNIQRIVNRERARRNQDHAESPS
jgi:hypothetical protein